MVRSFVRRLFGPPEAPDPHAHLQEVLTRLQGELREAKIRAADMIREEKRIASERDRYELEAESAERSAKAALESDQETAGRRHLERKLHAQEVAEELEQQRLAAVTEVQTMRTAIETYQLEIDRVERERRTWEMRQRTAELKSAMNGDAPSAALAEARQLMSDSREAAMREEARAEVRTQLSGADAQRQIGDRRRNLAVEKELQRLRGEVRGKAGE